MLQSARFGIGLYSAPFLKAHFLGEIVNQRICHKLHPKKSYATPRLTEYGDLRTLTQSSSNQVPTESGTPGNCTAASSKNKC